jgi:hypothetical protein
MYIFVVFAFLLGILDGILDYRAAKSQPTLQNWSGSRPSILFYITQKLKLYEYSYVSNKSNYFFVFFWICIPSPKIKIFANSLFSWYHFYLKGQSHEKVCEIMT